MNRFIKTKTTPRKPHAGRTPCRDKCLNQIVFLLKNKKTICKALKWPVFFFVLCIFFAQAPTAFSQAAKKAADSETFRALIIATGGFTKDAGILANLLSRDFGFQITRLFGEQAKKEAIEKAIRQITESAGPSDNILICYTGKGNYDITGKYGWWLPAGARPENPSDAVTNMIVYSQIVKTRARHLLLISDAPFSPALVGKSPPLSSGKKSRWALVAGKPMGGLMPSLIRVIGAQDSPRLGIREICRKMSKKTEPAPIFGPIKNTGDAGGDFTFVSIREGTSPEPQVAVPPPEPVKTPEVPVEQEIVETKPVSQKTTEKAAQQPAVPVTEPEKQPEPLPEPAKKIKQPIVTEVMKTAPEKPVSIEKPPASPETVKKEPEKIPEPVMIKKTPKKPPIVPKYPAKTQRKPDLQKLEKIRTLMDQGEAFLKEGKTEKAKTIYMKVLELDPGHKEARRRNEDILLQESLGIPLME